MSSNYPYTTSTATIKAFLEFIKSAGVPDKVTQEYLIKAGFKSTNDRPLIPMMKFIGLLNGSGSPTELWQSFRGHHSKTALASGIRAGYADLFALYPNANDKDNEALRNFFSSSTKVGAATIEYMVRSFKSLCDNADFKGAHVAGGPAAPIPTVEHVSPGATTTIVQTTQKPGCVVNINIQLTLPDSAKPETYEAFFEAMKKHLLQ